MFLGKLIGRGFESHRLHKLTNTHNMKTDYDYVIKAIRNKDNRLVHYPALKKLISIFMIKWNSNKNKRYEV